MRFPILIAARITLDASKWKACVLCNNPPAVVHWETIKGTRVRLLYPPLEGRSRCGADMHWIMFNVDAKRIGSWNGDDVEVCSHMVDLGD